MRIISKIQADIDWDGNARHPFLPYEEDRFDSTNTSITAESDNGRLFIRSTHGRTTKKGSALVLNIPFHNNYGHCIHDSLPKIMWQDRASTNVDVIYAGTSKLQDSLIELLGIRLKRTHLIDSPIEIKERYVSVQNHRAFHQRDYNKNILYKKQVDHAIKTKLGDRQVDRLIYCSRNHSSDVAHGRLMEKKQEEAILLMLEEKAQAEGLRFTLFHGQEDGKTMSHKKQMEIFSEAKIVVGGHGSAMANVIYTPKGTSICEFTSGTEVQVWGDIFNKHYNALNGYIFNDYADYNLIPFSKESTTEVTMIDLDNLKTFLNEVGS